MDAISIFRSSATFLFANRTGLFTLRGSSLFTLDRILIARSESYILIQNDDARIEKLNKKIK